MEQLMDFFSDVNFSNHDRVMEVLQEEGIDDLETLRAADEDDLRKAGLKMGDIIKIRKHLAGSAEGKKTEDYLNSSMSSNESESYEESKAANTQKKIDQHDEIKTQDVGPSEGTSNCRYSATDMLKKCLARTKRTKAQLYFRNLLRDCAREAKIWQKAYPLPSIPDGKLHKFFELITTAVPQLADHKAEVRMALGQALQNKRKYESDLKVGKRTTKKTRKQ